MRANVSHQESDLVKMVMAENEALLLTKKTLLEQLNEAEENSKNTDDQVFALRLRYRIPIRSLCTLQT